MKYLNRIILILLLALIMVTTLVLAIYSLGIVGQEFLGQLQDNLYGNISAAISFLVIFILSAWSLYPLFRRKTGTATISTTENGQVNISLRAMKKIIREVAYQEENIEVRNTNIDAREDGLYASLSISVQEEEDIPTLTGRLQHKIKDRLRDITGANIASVEILIENIEGKKSVDKFDRIKSKKQKAAEEEQEEVTEDETYAEEISPDISEEDEEELEMEEVSEEDKEAKNIEKEEDSDDELSYKAEDAKDVETEPENDLNGDIDEQETEEEEDKEDSSGFFS